MIILVIAYRPLLGDQHWSVLKSRLDRLMRRLGQQRLGCLVSDEVWSVFGCLIGNMLVTAQCVCVYAWSRLVNVSHNTTLRWVCVHGDVNWLIVECSLSQWLIMRVPWLRQCCSNRGSTTLCARVPDWVIEDVGVIYNLWLCELLVKIDHANPLVGKVKVAIWTCNSRTVLWS